MLHKLLKTSLVLSLATSSKAFSSHTQVKTNGFTSRREIIICDASRRDVLVNTATIVGGLGAFLPRPVLAKEELPITEENIKQYFGEVRYELEDPAGGVARIENALDKLDWADIKEFSKGYDLELRKKKMGYARKMMTEKKMKDEALALRNNVTFDLIGINKAARVQDEDNCREALRLLKEDVNKFLAMQELVQVPN